MRQNRNYCKLVDGALVYAPEAVKVNGRLIVNPHESHYVKADDGPWLPSQIAYVSKAAVEREIDALGLTDRFTSWLESKASYIGEWMRGGDVVEYDAGANAGDLASLIEALGIQPEDVPALIAKVEVRQ